MFRKNSTTYTGRKKLGIVRYICSLPPMVEVSAKNFLAINNISNVSYSDPTYVWLLFIRGYQMY